MNSRRVLVAVCLAALSLVVAGPVEGQTSAVTLFRDVSSVGLDLRLQRWHAATATVELDGTSLATLLDTRAAHDGGVRLDLGVVRRFDERASIALLKEQELLASGRVAWTGAVEGIALSSVTLVLDPVHRTLTAAIMYPGGAYEIRPLDRGVHAVSQLDPRGFPEDHPADDVPLEPSADELPVLPQVASDTGARIDVLVVYTAAARAAAGSTAAIESLIDTAVTQANQSYANSGITTRLRLKYTAMTEYVQHASLTVDRDRLTAQADGYLDEVHALRDAYGADIVSLIVADGDGGCGIGHINGPSTSYATKGFQVTRVNCAVANISFAHEVGHVQGARHDWYVDAQFSPPADSHNHGYVAKDGSWRTVMAYPDQCAALGRGCERIAFWSNPNLTRNGEPMGVPVGTANAADNRRTLNTNAWYIANFRQEVSTNPTRTTLVAPAGTITDLRPTYRWSPVLGSTYYQLWVQESGASTPLIQTWHTAGFACTATACAVTPNVALTPGKAYRWWVQTWNAIGAGPWSSVGEFASAAAPAVATLVAPSGSTTTARPTFTWNRVANSTWYYLWVQQPGAAISVLKWYAASEVCGTSICSVVSPVELGLGKTYDWWVQTWNAMGVGPWSAKRTFTVPNIFAPTLTSPVGGISTLLPTYTWPHSPNSTYYLLWVSRGGTAVIQTWYPAASICGATTCSVTPATALQAGAQHQWWVQTYGALGYGPWSAAATFTPASSVPGAVTLTGPLATAVSTVTPTFRWNAVTGATWYQMWVTSDGGITVHKKWYTAASVCGGSSCAVTPADTFSTGGYKWWVQSYGAGGDGPWSVTGTFSVNAAAFSAVLTWGAMPADLDLHLLTPAIGGLNHHVFWDDPGSPLTAPYATLDVDHTDGYGPETISVVQVSPGTYRYAVHLYSVDGVGGFYDGTTLAGSGAQVRLYSGGALVKTVTAPATGFGDYWHVCDVKSTGEMTCPNVISPSMPDFPDGSPFYWDREGVQPPKQKR